MTPRRIGFIGFGEVGSIFARAMHAAGRCEVAACDALLEAPGGRVELERRASTGGVRFVALAALVGESEVILSTVTTTSAIAAARAAAPHLVAGKTFVDLNSLAPDGKREIAGIVDATGAHFVEGAILNAVGVSGARARILIGDPAGTASADTLTHCGLNAVHYSREIGRASAFKLLRSVFSKGLEALLIEFLVAGRRAGLQEELWREAVDTIAQHGFERAATNWIQTHASAHERRYHEMVQVTEAVRALGVEPVMTAATEEFFRRSGASGLTASAAGQSVSVDDVVRALAAAPPQKTTAVTSSARQG